MSRVVSETIHLDAANFDREVLESSIPVLVDFWAPWCAPCRALAPVIDGLAGELAGTVKVAKLDIDTAPEIAVRFSIHSIPTLLLFRGGQVVDRMIGATSKLAITTRLSSVLQP